MRSTLTTPTKHSKEGFRRVRSRLERRIVQDMLRLGRHKRMMHGLLEVDVTRARGLLRNHRERTGESISFTAYVLACVGRAVAAHPEVHGVNDVFSRSVLFEDVDATTIIEAKTAQQPFPLAHVIRATNRRSVRELHEEIRSVQARGEKSVSPSFRHLLRLYLMFPSPVRDVIYWAIFSSPLRFKRWVGTLMVSSVGMFGRGIGWGFSAPSVHNLSVTIGGIGARSVPAGIRETLCLTVSADHRRIDGGPLARFASQLAHNVESAELLEEFR